MHEPEYGNWCEAPLRDLVDSDRRITYGIVQPGEWQEKSKGVALIRGQDYSSGEVNVEQLRYVHPSVASAYARSTVKPGDILLSIVGYVGLCAEVPIDADGANITQTTARIAPRKGICNRFFLQYFRSSQFREEIKKYTKGSAQPGLNLADVEKMLVRYPSAEFEQGLIAKILDTLDTQIRQTEALITKLEWIKQGLLTDLLTRGIDQNGQLRPTTDQAPHLYKDSPLGRIPREWELLYGNDCFELFSGSMPAHLREDSAGEYLYLKVDDFNNPLNARGLMVAACTFAASAAKSVRLFDHGHIIFPKRGAAILQNRVQLLRVDATVDPNLMVMKVREMIIPEFFRELLIDFGLHNICDNSGIPQINNKHLYPLVFALPSLSEQSEILARLKACDTLIEDENDDFERLSALKNGLMDDLLTGRVRVTPLLEAAQ